MSQAAEQDHGIVNDRHQDGGNNEHHAAHRRRAQLGQVAVGQFQADAVPCFLGAQYPDQGRSPDHGQHKGHS